MIKKNYIKQFKRLRENLNIIILVPTILGGLWQILELASISTSYIRFFSLTQLIADGLLILFILMIIYLIIKLTMFLLKTETFTEMFGIEESSPSILKILVTLSIPFLFLILDYKDFKSFINFVPASVMDIFHFIIMGIVFIGFSLLGILKTFMFIIYHYNKKSPNSLMKYLENKEKRDKLVKRISILVSLLIFLTLMLIPWKILPGIKTFRNAMVLPENLINLKLENNKIKSIYKLKNNPEMLYLNDSYLFYRIERVANESEVLIIKTEDLVKLDTCR